MNETTLLSFLGWASVINLVSYVLAATVYLVGAQPVANWYAKRLGVSADKFKAIWVLLLGWHKLLLWVFFMVPYLALRIVAALSG